MTLAVLQASVLQTNGALSVGAAAQVTVRTPAGALATLYTDRAGTTSAGNPVTADSAGFFRVYTTPGRYDVTVTTSSGTQVYEDIALFADGFAPGGAATADIGTATGEVIGTDEAREYFGLDYEPTVLPTISSDFERNKHELYEQYGNEPKTILQTWTTTRATTGTYRDAAGVIRTAGIDEPRIDYDPVTGRGALLVEEARTNLVTYSEQFDNAAWGKINSSITANAALAPDGTMSMDLLADNVSTTSLVFTAQNKSLTADTTYTLSFYVKRKDYRYMGIQPASIVNWAGQTDVRIFDLETLTQTSGTTSGSSITDEGNGVCRISISVLFGAATTSGGVNIYTSSSGTDVNVARTIGNGNYIWGGDIEAGSTPSSYIPTVASSVTRSADNVSRVLGDEFTADGFTVFGEFIFKRLDTSNRTLAIGTGAGDRIELIHSGLVTEIAGGATRTISISPAMDAGTKYNLAYSVTRTAVTLSINGALIGSVAVDDALLTATRLWLSGNASGAGEPTISYSSAKYIPRALSDAELQEMTKL